MRRDLGRFPTARPGGTERRPDNRTYAAPLILFSLLNRQIRQSQNYGPLLVKRVVHHLK